MEKSNVSARCHVPVNQECNHVSRVSSQLCEGNMDHDDICHYVILQPFAVDDHVRVP
jgi:hypothetical protein